MIIRLHLLVPYYQILPSLPVFNLLPLHLHRRWKPRCLAKIADQAFVPAAARNSSLC